MPDFLKKTRARLRETFRRTSRPGSSANSPSPSPVPPDPSPPIASASTSLTYANPPKPASAIGTTGSVIHELLATARDGADLCLPLKAALVGVVKVWDICKRTSEVKDEYLRANGKLAHLHKIAIAYGKEKGLDEKLQNRLYEISDALEHLTAFVQEKVDRGLVVRVLESNEDIATVKGLLESVSSLLDVFQFESIVTIELCLKEVLHRLSVTEEERRATERAKELVKDREKVTRIIKTVLGENFVSDAAHDEQPIHAGCMPGTREGILDKLVAWVLTHPTAIFWLAGMAGTGKTSIAVTLSRMLQLDPAVTMGGGFFCSRSAGSVARTDVRRILPTLAGLLASKSPEFSRALAAELEEDPRVAHKPVAEQIGPLLRKPLAALSTTTIPIVFVIDALDECGDQLELAQLIKDIAEFKSDAKVKFILTSRPEMHIRGTPIADTRFSSILQLHTISEAEVTSDIRLYIERTLENCSPDTKWFTPHDVDILLKLSSGLFIFASTVLKYILARVSVHGRVERLRKATAAFGEGTSATATLDKVYEMVIIEASRSDQVDTDELQEVKQVLACILTARSSLSVQALAELMNMKPTGLRESLDRLHSVIYLPTEDAEPGLRTLHASFGDFLFDARRAPPNMHIDPALGHGELARGCLARLAQDDLCFSISRSESSYICIAEPSQADWIPPPLIYACLHWAHHVEASSDRLALEVYISKFFRPKLLFWLEAMVILGKVEHSSSLLRIAALSVQDTEIVRFLRDATSFVDTSYSAIEKTPSHIYLSALPFAPKDSLVHQDFYHLCTNVVSVETLGIDRHGGNLAMTLIGHEASVNSVVYSPDGLVLASGSNDGTVRLWDTRTGQAISPLRSGEGGVRCVAFSPNGRFVASGTKEGPIHLCDARTGLSTMQPLLGHTRQVNCVTFSPDGTLIASAGNDHLVCLWNAENGHLLAAMEGHSNYVNVVAFNPEGSILASGSDDTSVRRWDVCTRGSKGIAFSDSHTFFKCLEYSPDSSVIAIGFDDDQEVRVWNAEFEGAIISVIATQATPNAIAFSSDSACIITATERGITSWNWRSGQKISTLHVGEVVRISYSPDGSYIASTSSDHNAYIWNAKISHNSVQTLEAHGGGVNAVALAEDGRIIASASEDGTVRLWNAMSGEPMMPPLVGHQGAVNSVAISPDGRMVASASADGTIRIWDMETGVSVGEPLRGHEGSIKALAFSPDGTRLASAGSDKSVRFWQMSTRGPCTEVETLLASSELHSLAYAPDGRLIAAGDSDGDVWIWSTTQGEKLERQLIGSWGHVRSVTFSPNGNLIASASRSRIQAWNAQTEDSGVAWKLKGHLEPSTVQFSSSGQQLVSGAHDGSICIWDMETKAVLHTLHGHGAEVRSAVLTPDHMRVMSCSDDGTIRIWNLADVTSPEQQSGSSTITNFALVRRNDGWLVGPSDELLLWVPPDYIGNLAIEGTTLIAKHKVSVTIPDGGCHGGTNWTACWRG